MYLYFVLILLLGSLGWKNPICRTKYIDSRSNIVTLDLTLSEYNEMFHCLLIKQIDRIMFIVIKVYM